MKQMFLCACLFLTGLKVISDMMGTTRDFSAKKLPFVEVFADCMLSVIKRVCNVM